MVTPELKCPTTNFTPSPANLLATDTPSFGSARSSPSSAGELLAENAAGRVDVGDRLFGAVLELRPECGAAAGERAADAELDVAAAAACPARAQRRSPRRGRARSLRNAFHVPIPSGRLGVEFRLIQAPFGANVTYLPCNIHAPSLRKPVLARHLAGAGHAKPGKAEDQRDRGIDCVIVRRDQGRAEQREVDEAHRRRRSAGSRRPPSTTGSRRLRPRGRPSRRRRRRAPR